MRPRFVRREIVDDERRFCGRWEYFVRCNIFDVGYTKVVRVLGSIRR
jgi:hypothetical protein